MRQKNYIQPYIKVEIIELEHDIVASSATIITTDTDNPVQEEWDGENTIPKEINW